MGICAPDMSVICLNRHAPGGNVVAKPLKAIGYTHEPIVII